jgi:lambda family phage portal protein
MSNPGWLNRATNFFKSSSAPAPSTVTTPVEPKRKRMYEAASTGRLAGHQGLFSSASSADTEIFAAGRILRDRSRDLVRNNAHAAKAVDALTRNIIGDGITPRPKLDDKDANRRVTEAFKNWARRGGCDADGLLNFAALQVLAVREMIEGGEVLIRRSIQSSDKRQPIPLQLQLLEADFLDPYRDGPLAPGSIAIQGVEIATTGEQSGKRVRYWLYEQHPGSLWFNSAKPMVSVPVDASEILHVYERQRTQIRGVPWGTPSFEGLSNLGDYEHAEIVRKKTEACAVAFVTTEDNAQLAWNRVDPDDIDDAADVGVFDYRGNPIESFEPGQVAYLQGGKEVKFNTPGIIGGYAEYKTSQLRTIAAGFRVPYELLSGDLSQVNFSSGRLGLIEFRRFVSSVQQHILIPMLLDPVWDWFCEAAYLAGVIDTPYVPVEWAMPRFDYINPVDDVQADNLSVRSGLRSWEDVVASNGRDPDVVYEEIRRQQERARKDGVILDSDPSAVSGRGVAQKADTTAMPAPKSKKKNKKSGKKPPIEPIDAPDDK